LSAAEKADCTISMADADLVGMMSGKLNAQKVWHHLSVFRMV